MCWLATVASSVCLLQLLAAPSVSNGPFQNDMAAGIVRGVVQLQKSRVRSRDVVSAREWRRDIGALSSIVLSVRCFRWFALGSKVVNGGCTMMRCFCAPFLC